MHRSMAKKATIDRHKHPQVGIRLSPEEKARFEKAASANKMDTLAQWMRWALRRAADDILGDTEKQD